MVVLPEMGHPTSQIVLSVSLFCLERALTTALDRGIILGRARSAILSQSGSFEGEKENEGGKTKEGRIRKKKMKGGGERGERGRKKKLSLCIVSDVSVAQRPTEAQKIRHFEFPLSLIQH